MVTWTAHAKAQLRHIHTCIAQDSVLYARCVSEDSVQKTIGLDELPREGRKAPELDDDAVRELGIYSCRLSSAAGSPRSGMTVGCGELLCNGYLNDFAG